MTGIFRLFCISTPFEISANFQLAYRGWSRESTGCGCALRPARAVATARWGMVHAVTGAGRSGRWRPVSAGGRRARWTVHAVTGVALVGGAHWGPANWPPVPNWPPVIVAILTEN